ncbi:MAG TPA: IS701 family transposase [Thermomicrobiales bacterium]|jgi:SRSO17 transposase
MELATEEGISEAWGGVLATLRERLAPRFSRAEPRRRVRAYLAGLVGTAARKNGWQLAEAAGEATPYGMQRLLSAARRDAEAVRDDLRAFVTERLGDPEGVLIVDETGFLKQGDKSAGVARQYSGTAGRIENCQVGVFLAYAGPHGCAFLDRALYLPDEWAADADRRAAAGVPEGVAFATKGELAQAMLARAFAAAVPASWVVGDTVYGGDELRRWLEGQGRPYALAVASDHGVWTRGERAEARALADALPTAAWARASAGDGAQGPRWYDWACLALPYDAADGWAHWLLVRRSIGALGERAYYRVYARADTAPGAMVRAVGRRWGIEAAFADAKGLVGLDHYEVRRWAGWYRHVTLSLLAHAALVAARAAATAAEKGARTA